MARLPRPRRAAERRGEIGLGWYAAALVVKASFLGIVFGTQLPDLFTKAFVYSADDPAAFHRGWPGVGFSHSLKFGVVFATAILAITRSRGWALGVLIGQWAQYSPTSPTPPA